MSTKLDKSLALMLVERLNKQSKANHTNIEYGLEECDDAEKSKVFCVVDDSPVKTYI